MGTPELDAALAQVDVLLSAAPEAICFVDRELRCVRVNRQLAGLTGLAVPDHVGRRLPDLLPVGDGAPGVAGP